jgi:hypothetical protein
MQLKVITDITDQKFRKSYTQFLRANSTYYVQLELDWLDAYIANYNISEFQFLCFYNNNDLVAVIPIQIKKQTNRRLFKKTTILLLGNGPTDFFDLPIKKGFEEKVSEKFAKYLIEKKEWENFILSELPEHNLLVKALSIALKKVDISFKIDKPNGFLYSLTNTNYEKFFENFLKPRNKDLLKDLRGLNSRGINLSLETINTNIYEKLSEVLKLYESRRTTLGQENSYNTEERRHFVKQVCDAFEKKGMAELTILKDESNNLWAFQLDWISNGIRYHWNHAFNEDFKKHSPGKIILYYLLEQSFNSSNINECNHMRGELGYKTKLAEHHQSLIRISIYNNRSLTNKITKFVKKLKNKLK